MTAAQARFFDSASVPIRYIELGRGEPVVLVHSYTGTFESQFVRSGFAGAVAQRYRVVGFDLRGHGQSGKPHDPACYGREMALDVVRLLDHLAIPRAHMLGYSLGAHILVQLLTLHPERFVTAILGGGAGRRRWSAEHEARAEEEARELEQGGMEKQILRLWPADAPRPDQARLRELSRRYLAGNDTRALAAMRRANGDQVASDAALAAVHVPVLGIAGTQDPYLAGLRDLTAIVPDMHVVAIQGATHDAAAARPEFLQAVLEFLAGHTAGDSSAAT